MDIEDLILVGAAILAYGLVEAFAKEFAQHILKPWKTGDDDMGAEDRRDVAKLASDAIHWCHELEEEVAELQEWKENVEARLAAMEEEEILEEE